MDSNEDVPPVPQRPLTAYNLFSILERNYIVQQHQKPDTADTANAGLDPYTSQRPARYRDLVLPSNWYVVGMNRKKRCDHKNHGVISFQNLSKTASENWKEADEEVVAYCKMVAAEELKRYRKDQAAFKEKYGEEAFNAQKKTYKKRPKEDARGTSKSKKVRNEDSDNKGEEEREDESVTYKKRPREDGRVNSDGKKARKVDSDSKGGEESENKSKDSSDGGTNKQETPRGIEHYFAHQQVRAMPSMFGFSHIMGNTTTSHQQVGFSPLRFGYCQIASSATANSRDPFFQSNTKAKGDVERMTAESGSGYSSDFSIGEWIASGQEAAKAFDNDDE